MRYLSADAWLRQPVEKEERQGGYPGFCTDWLVRGFGNMTFTLSEYRRLLAREKEVRQQVEIRDYHTMRLS